MSLRVFFFCQYWACWYDVLHSLIKLFTESAFATCFCLFIIIFIIIILKNSVFYYEGYSKINLRLVGKNKRVVIASKRTLNSNKELLFLLYAYPHTFSPRSVGVKARQRFVLLREENESQHVPHSWRERLWQCPRFISIYSYITRRKCMRVRVQQEQKFLVTTERALWRYDNAFIFTNQSEVDFGITLVTHFVYYN